MLMPEQHLRNWLRACDVGTNDVALDDVPPADSTTTKPAMPLPEMRLPGGVPGVDVSPPMVALPLALIIHAYI